MTQTLTRSETLQTDSIGELVDSPLFDVTWEQQDITFPLATFDPLSDGEPHLTDVRLSAEVLERALRFVSLSCEWSLASSATSSGRSLDGEFHLPHLYLALVRDAPRYNDLALSYPEYLDVLRLTKGVFGWQLLFVDVSLREPGLRPHLESITTMLEVFPSVFPQHDYAPLQGRLAARL
ncbi:hypothetical protein C8K30_11214 [Promicromonospora sp. AC04]|uniref:hypothetical protein n=1 Tax=Promicromonospora sp. AC04 TaxID=2135723 RepID=UPI000D391BE3|nr:hypothetical protein [Promicromonospora sp. AC04]PUB22792.1 hypothetical protein C8K30_11214 [Promicromonospora sp. AC04]